MHRLSSVFRVVLACSLPVVLVSTTLVLTAGGAQGALLTPLDRQLAAQRAHEDVYGSNPAIKGTGPLTKIGYDLALVFHEYQAFKAAGGSPVSGPPFTPTLTLVRHEAGSVVIDAVATGDGESLLGDLTGLGMPNGAAFQRIVSGLMPIDALDDVGALTSLHSASPARMMTDVGLVDSQGDAAMVADEARLAFGVDGTGITVGTLSDSYDDLGGAATDVLTGDLPAGILVLDDSASGTNTDEGRGMMQIIADVAPGADQAFHTAFGGQANFAQGIVDLMNAGCEVINDDVIYLTEPFFSDGIIAQACDQVRANNVIYFSAALNYGRRSYEATYRPTGFSPPGTVNHDAHDFDPGAGADVFQSVTIDSAATLTVSFQWDQPYFVVSGPPGCANDVDVYLYDATGSTIIASSTTNNVNGSPIEFFEWTNPGGAANFNLVIAKQDFGGTTPDPGLIKTIVLGATFNEYATDSPTSIGHPNAAGAVGTAAAFYGDTPEFGVDPPVAEGFSAVGGVPILFDLNGNPVNIVRQRPLITAPNGTNTTFFGNDIPQDPDAFPNFFGTSAAAPHAAGVAALLLEFDPLLTPGNIETLLTSTAIDMDDPFTPGFDVGFDHKSGFGLIQADRALCTYDGAPPTVICSLVGGPVDANCVRVLTFSMSATDVYGMNLDDLTFSLSTPGGATIGSIQSTGTQVDVHTASRTGTVEVQDLTGCLATVRLEVQAIDACGQVAPLCVEEVEVTDETPPTLSCPTNITVECVSHCGTSRDDPQLASFFGAVTATDNCDGDVLITDDAPDCFPVGDTVVIFSATDNCGLQTTCPAVVTVEDTTPPVITVDLDRYSLWPPNHKLVPIHATVEVTDICDPDPTFVLTGISSNEPEEGLGDGDFPDDIQGDEPGTADVDFLLRSERSGLGDGRIYTIVYTATDASGNSAESVSEVRVSHDRAGAALAALGFLSDGTQLVSQVESFVLVITSLPGSVGTSALDATGLLLHETYVGNTAGAIRPDASAQGDVNGDGLEDVAFFYGAAPALEILARSDVVDGPLAMHFETPEGTGYVVADIFALGPPVAMDVFAPDPVGVEEPVAIVEGPRETRLTGAYPNPFRPSVTIGFALARDELVKLVVYDARGARVRTLLDRARPIGTHQVVWDGRTDNGSPVASGVYFVGFRAGSIRSTQRIVMLK